MEIHVSVFRRRLPQSATLAVFCIGPLSQRRYTSAPTMNDAERGGILLRPNRAHGVRRTARPESDRRSRRFRNC